MPATNRKFWAGVGDGIKAAKENMQPLLKGWLVASIAGKNIPTHKSPATWTDN